MVAPVRCATPGTEVDCATQPSDSATSTIQSASTPPPCPPIARMAIDNGFSRDSWSSVGFNASIIATSRKQDAARLAPALQPTDNSAADIGHQAIPPRRVEDD